MSAINGLAVINGLGSINSGTINGLGAINGITSTGVPAPTMPWLTWTGVQYVMDLNNTWMSWKEDVSSIATTSAQTHATTNGDTIGQVDDYSVNAHSLQCVSAGTRPTLTSMAGMPSGALFAFAGNILQVQNSTKAFGFIQKTGIFTIACRLNFTAHDTTLLTICENNSLTTANNGFFFIRNAASKLNLNITKGTGSVASLVSTTSITAASGTVPVIIRGDGVNMKMYINSTTQDATVAFGAFAASDAIFNLFFGRSQTSSSPLDATIGDVVICNTAITNQQMSDYFAYSPPARQSINPVGWIPGCTMLHSAFDFTGTLYSGLLFTDALGGTSAYTNGLTVKVAATNGDPLGVLNRYATAPTTKGPVFTDAATGGNLINSCYSNGTDTELDYSVWPSGGARTYIFAWKNIGTDNNSGPHDASVFVGDATGLVRTVNTSIAYNPPNGNNAWHLAGGVAVLAPTLINAGSNWNMIIYRVNGSAKEAWCNGQNYATATSGLGFSVNRFFVCTTPAFEWMMGYAGVVEEYSGYLPNITLNARIAAIATALQIPNVTSV